MSERTVVATPYAPTGATGGSRRVLSLLAALDRLGPVTLVYVPFEGEEPSQELERLENLDLRAVRPSRGFRRLRTYADARRAGAPDSFARGASSELADEAVAAAGSEGRIVADGLSAAASLIGVMRRRPVVYCAQNLESGFRHELEGADGAAGLERFETLLLRLASQSWVPSPREVTLAHELVAEADVRHIPNVVDVATITVVSPRRGERRLLFAADHTYPPNRDALGWLVGEIMPAVWARAPESKLTLTGRGLPVGIAGHDPRIEALGFVDDLPAVYASSDVVLVPLRQGGGSPLKLIEALACALPVVATPKAAAGLELAAGEHYFEGEDATGLADAVVAALGPEGDLVGSSGRTIAEQRYSVEALTELVRQTSLSKP
ncbi:MAG: glycosyltransferase [Solirubrobacteraceae bacterium]|nr:glycosyltransferase [Solirubrobacteraceae bacterium]